MIFNREEMLRALDVAKVAIDQRDFIPILAHFCFQGKAVTAYNDFIGVQVSLQTNFVCALQANTLLRLLNSVATEEVEIGFTDKKVFFKSGRARVGVRCRLPYMQEEDFFFSWPNLKRLEQFNFSPAGAEKLFEGIELCLSSVGDQTPAQMGVTLGKHDDQFKMYSTNNHAISTYRMKDPGFKFDYHNKILSTQFCKAMLKARAAYPDEKVSLAMTDEFVLMQFGKVCKVYGKLANNKDPLDFEKVIKGHMPSNYARLKQELPVELLEAFERSLLVLQGDISKQVTIELSLKTVTVESTSSLGKLKSGARFAKEFKPNKFRTDAELACKAIPGATHVFFGERIMIFSQGPYMHLLGHQPVE